MEDLGLGMCIVLFCIGVGWLCYSVANTIIISTEHSICERQHNVSSCVTIYVPNTEKELIEKFKLTGETHNE